MTDNPDQYVQEAAATLLAMEAAATLLAMQAEASPAVNIRRFPILPEAPEPDNLPHVAGRAAFNESRRVPYNLEELTWGARRRRTQRQ
ncbi:hypothetical protein SLA2020_020720 [Shorea laevis]